MRVRGVKGVSWVGESEGRGRVLVESEGCVVLNVDCGAGAVEGRTAGLGSGGSREVVRTGGTGCASACAGEGEAARGASLWATGAGLLS